MPDESHSPKLLAETENDKVAAEESPPPPPPPPLEAIPIAPIAVSTPKFAPDIGLFVTFFFGTKLFK